VRARSSGVCTWRLSHSSFAAASAPAPTGVAAAAGLRLRSLQRSLCEGHAAFWQAALQYDASLQRLQWEVDRCPQTEQIEKVVDMVTGARCKRAASHRVFNAIRRSITRGFCMG